ncbi:hypothetical protein PGH12_06690 [Chryseobacterium wangxinyae]|uniref:hypothetical protein n=1 Tax=Chryseobacterium sp. CY350 TaxID=2997336 RepID=UPI00226F78A5|nr:hypothetical protein [Chryseobacterium sp. CY350]MCY0976837.1 hypothetical protein [Chryseobacterium sp. CY350]WBZ96838.1 hypothetical protein PGH12_06690 [Chryseobacterium sp. CY350]
MKIEHLLILFLLTITSCNGQNNQDCLNSLDKKLSPKIDQENKIGEIISMRDSINCFEWDTLIVHSTIGNKKNIEKDLGITIPFEYSFSSGDERAAMLLFLKDNKVVNYILQKPTVDRKTYDQANSIKVYYFIYLVNNYGNDVYAKIPKELAVFETYPVIYHDEEEETKWALKYGLGIKIKEQK